MDKVFYHEFIILGVKLTEVAESSSLSTSTCVAVINTSHMQQLLGNRGTDNTSTTWSRDESHYDAAALACDLDNMV